MNKILTALFIIIILIASYYWGKLLLWIGLKNIIITIAIFTIFMIAKEKFIDN
jgi:hypothetical protein